MDEHWHRYMYILTWFMVLISSSKSSSLLHSVHFLLSTCLNTRMSSATWHHIHMGMQCRNDMYCLHVSLPLRLNSRLFQGWPSRPQQWLTPVALQPYWRVLVKQGPGSSSTYSLLRLLPYSHQASIHTASHRARYVYTLMHTCIGMWQKSAACQIQIPTDYSTNQLAKDNSNTTILFNVIFHLYCDRNNAEEMFSQVSQELLKWD